MQSYRNTLTFRSRIDWWLATIVFGPLVVAAWLVGATVWRQPTFGNWVAAAVTGFVLASVGWLYATTTYEVGLDTLLVRYGPFRERVPISDIRLVSASRTPLAAPALSLRRLEIAYGKSRVAIVSPEDQVGFIVALVAHNPAIEIREGMCASQETVTATAGPRVRLQPTHSVGVSD